MLWSVQIQRKVPADPLCSCHWKTINELIIKASIKTKKSIIDIIMGDDDYNGKYYENKRNKTSFINKYISIKHRGPRKSITN